MTAENSTLAVDAVFYTPLILNLLSHLKLFFQPLVKNLSLYHYGILRETK